MRPMPNDRQRCNVCDSRLRLAFPVVRDPQTGHSFRILRCPDCGLGHTTPQPEDLGVYYGPRYYGGRHGMTERFCLARRMRLVSAVARPSTLLDFGCGDGGFLAAAAASGWQAVGVEVEQQRARAAGLTVLEHIENTSGPFDLITLWHSLEHTRSPRAVIEALADRLTHRGTLIVAVPNFAGLQARLCKSLWFHLDVPRHLFHFTPLALTRLLQGCGLEVVRRWDLELEMDLFGWTQSALNRVIRTPNVLFDALTHRGRYHKPLEIGASFVFGIAATIAAAPAVPLTAALSCGASVVLAAQKRAGLG
jgi:SAM-dependent methyltransferase